MTKGQNQRAKNKQTHVYINIYVMTHAHIFAKNKQVMESIMCVFEGNISVKRSLLSEYSPPPVEDGEKNEGATMLDDAALMPGKRQCRACSDMNKPGTDGYPFAKRNAVEHMLRGW